MPLRVMQDEESANELAWWRDSSSPLQLLELRGGHVESTIRLPSQQYLQSDRSARPKFDNFMVGCTFRCSYVLSSEERKNQVGI